MGNTSCRCKKANCEANSRYFIITVDDGSQEAKNLHLYPLQIDVNSFLAGNPSKILSSSSPSPPPPYQPNNENNKNDDNNDNNDNDDANNNVNNNNNDNDNNENVDNNIEEKSADDYFLKNENVKINNSDRENKKEPSKNINSDNNNPEKNNNVNENIEKKNLTLDVNKEIIVEKNSDNIINNNDLNNQNNNINDNNDNNNNDNDNKETKGNEKEEKVKRTTVIFQIYHCQSHISSREEIVHIKVIATDGNNRGSGHLRYEREGLKGIREMVASAVPHAELGSWYHWQILSPISSVPIPLNDLSSETPIRLFNVSDQTFLSYYDDHHGGNNNNINDSFVHFGNQGVPVTFFLKPLHLHFLSSN